MKTKVRYLGGATFLIEVGSFRFLTDPGFDPNGLGRHLLRAVHHRLLRTQAFVAWDAVTCAC